ncbi:MAG: SDR family oxidoreductase [Wenzhouxiangellaceae bacterium]|nr:SDR family oxidoreductase [Wenzhouxiangellaceae bacterium]
MAVVTGASAGLGSEYARQLAARGWDLVLTARREERLAALASEIEREHGTAARVVSADLADPEAPGRIVEAAGEDPKPALLVNNAGYAIPGHYNAADWEAHRDFLQVMVRAVAELTWRLLPGIREQGRGGVINVASLAGIAPGSSGHTLYPAVKAWLIKFSESLAVENASAGIRVQAFCPGFTRSEFHAAAGTEDVVSRVPGFMWMQADDAVGRSLDQFEKTNGTTVYVPGAVNKFLAMLSRKLPYRTTLWIAGGRAGRFRRD